MLINLAAKKLCQLGTFHWPKFGLRYGFGSCQLSWNSLEFPATRGRWFLFTASEWTKTSVNEPGWFCCTRCFFFTSHKGGGGGLSQSGLPKSRKPNQKTFKIGHTLKKKETVHSKRSFGQTPRDTLYLFRRNDLLATLAIVNPGINNFFCLIFFQSTPLQGHRVTSKLDMHAFSSQCEKTLWQIDIEEGQKNKRRWRLEARKLWDDFNGDFFLLKSPLLTSTPKLHENSRHRSSSGVFSDRKEKSWAMETCIKGLLWRQSAHWLWHHSVWQPLLRLTPWPGQS